MNETVAFLAFMAALADIDRASFLRLFSRCQFFSLWTGSSACDTAWISLCVPTAVLQSAMPNNVYLKRFRAGLVFRLAVFLHDCLRKFQRCLFFNGDAQLCEGLCAVVAFG